MATITSIPFVGNAVVSFSGDTYGGLRSASVSTTQDTWDSTAHDNTSAVRTFAGTYSGATVSVGGVFDYDDTGQTALDVAIKTAAAAELIVTFKTGDTVTVQAVCTAYNVTGDHEGGWEWDAEFQCTGVAVWAV